MLESQAAQSADAEPITAFDHPTADLLVGVSSLAARIARADRDHFRELVQRFPNTQAFKSINDQTDAAELARAFEIYARRSIAQLDSDGLKALLPTGGASTAPFADSYSRIPANFGISAHDRLLSLIGPSHRDANLNAYSFFGDLVPGQMINILGKGAAEIVEISETHMIVRPLNAPAEPITIPRHRTTSELPGATGRQAFATEAVEGTDVYLPVVAYLSDVDAILFRDRINALRSSLHIGEYAETMPGTISIARGAGRDAIGVNSSLSAAMLRLSPHQRREIRRLMRIQPGDESNFIDHAELASLFALREQLGGAMPRIVELMVDRPTCPSCFANLGRVAAYLGVEELHVFVVGPRENRPPPLVFRATP